ncbi:hypothetical protein RTBOTA2_006699, partial [Rhodotorula toruloides]
EPFTAPSLGPPRPQLHLTASHRANSKYIARVSEADPRGESVQAQTSDETDIAAQASARVWERKKDARLHNTHSLFNGFHLRWEWSSGLNSTGTSSVLPSVEAGV